jgi:hypothetical protein
MTNLEGVLRIVELALAEAPLTLPSPPAARVERKT